MVKRGKKASALQTISDDNAGGRREGEGTAPMEQIMDLIQSIENGGKMTVRYRLLLVLFTKPN